MSVNNLEIKAMKQRIDGPKGWYNIVYDKLLSEVRGYIKAGFSKQKALEMVFDASCASKGIKHKIEDLILNK